MWRVPVSFVLWCESVCHRHSWLLTEIQAVQGSEIPNESWKIPSENLVAQLKTNLQKAVEENERTTPLHDCKLLKDLPSVWMSSSTDKISHIYLYDNLLFRNSCTSFSHYTTGMQIVSHTINVSLWKKNKHKMLLTGQFHDLANEEQSLWATIWYCLFDYDGKKRTYSKLSETPADLS